MLQDSLTKAALYEGAHPLFKQAFAWLREHAATEPFGRYEVQGTQVYAMPQGYTTHTPRPERFETHQRYIDIQLVVEGEETIYVGDPQGMTPTEPHNPTKDIAFFKGEGEAHTLRAGDFLVLYPHEAHLPGCEGPKGPTFVRKVVVKVALNA